MSELQTLHETLYVSDLDGTLLNDEQLLSQESSSFLADAISKGLNFTYATARSITSSQFGLYPLPIKMLCSVDSSDCKTRRNMMTMASPYRMLQR